MTLVERFHVDGEPRDAELADLDGDGWLDVITVIRDADKVQAYRNNNGALVLSAEVTVGKSPRELATADFNGDGCPDFIVVNRKSYDVSVLLGCGGGAVAFQSLNQTLPVDGEVSALRLADLNGDSLADVLQAHRASGDVSVRLAQPGGTLTAPVFFPMGMSVNDLDLADVNGDGRADLLTASLGLSHNPGSLGVRLGLPGGSFGALTQVTLPDPISQPECRLLAVKAADFDGDGKADLAASFTDSRIVFLRGNGAGNFAAMANYADGFPSFVFAVQQMAVADFDGDGDVDLAGVGFYGELGILTNDGNLLTSTTLTPTLYSAAHLNPLRWYRARELRVEDLNGDADPDLAMGLDAGVSAYFGSAGTTFTPGQFSPGPGVPALPGAQFPVNGFTFGDFDGDGDRDLAVTCLADKCLTILSRQTGPPMFAKALEVKVPSAAFVASGDLDGDGQADLVGSGQSALWVALSSQIARPQAPAVVAFNRPKATGVVINEIMSSNASTPLPIGDDRFSDWVELFNAGTTTVNLGEWILEAEEEGVVSHFAFPPNTVLGPGSRLLVLCSNAGIIGPLKTGWKISSDGGTLRLKQPGGTLVDQVDWPPQAANVSYMRFTDGALSWTATSMASPGAANTYTGAVPPTLTFRGFDVANFAPNIPIVLTALATDDVDVIAVSMSWRRIDLPNPTWQRVLFYDDGQHGDGAMGDGIFAGSIPDGLPATAQIEFYLEATDTSGLTVYQPTEPGLSDDVGSSAYYTLAFSPEPSPLQVSEVVAANSFWVDSLGNMPDYVELHNPSAEPIELSDYGMLDSGLKTQERFRFPAGAVLPPGGRCLVLCSGLKELPWHASFKLNRAGDSVYLQRQAAGTSWLTVEKVDLTRNDDFATAYARPAAHQPFQWLPATPGTRNTCLPGMIQMWHNARPTSQSVYLVFPTQLNVPWTLQKSNSVSSTWESVISGIGDGKDANQSVPAGGRSGFYRIVYQP